MTKLDLSKPLYYHDFIAIRWFKCEYIDTKYNTEKDGSHSTIYLVKVFLRDSMIIHKLVSPYELTNDKTGYDKEIKAEEIRNKIEELQSELKKLQDF